MKKILAILLLIGIAAGIFYVKGYYPVALVNGHPIWESTWEKLQQATMHNVAFQLKETGGKEINFFAPENASVLLGIREGTLTTLIENALLKQGGTKMVGNFTDRVTQKITDAVHDWGAVDKLAKAMYGYKRDDMMQFIFMPQSSRDVIREKLESQQKTFEEWFADIKKTASVRLFFTSLTWNGGEIE